MGLGFWALGFGCWDLLGFFLPPAWLGRTYDAGSLDCSQDLYSLVAFARLSA